MKSINSFILEKLQINKNIASKATTVKIDNTKRNPKFERIDYYAYLTTDTSSSYYKESKKHIDKMTAYMNKNSNPSRLVSSIKSLEKLCKRWYAAIILKWDDAILEFGNAIVDRENSIDINDLHAYVIKKLSNWRYYPAHKEALENYIELYDIEVVE